MLLYMFSKHQCVAGKMFVKRLTRFRVKLIGFVVCETPYSQVINAGRRRQLPPLTLKHAFAHKL